MNEKYGPNYNHMHQFHETKENQDKYNAYCERYYERYWDTKDNDAYYSQPLTKRAWITFKKVTSFYADCALLLFGGALFLLFNAH